eukprot:403363140
MHNEQILERIKSSMDQYQGENDEPIWEGVTQKIDSLNTKSFDSTLKRQIKLKNPSMNDSLMGDFDHYKSTNVHIHSNKESRKIQNSFNDYKMRGNQTSLNSQAHKRYKSNFDNIQARVNSMRSEDDPLNPNYHKKSKFEAEEDKLDDLPLFDSNAGSKIGMNNLHKIRLKVEQEITKSANEAQKKFQDSQGNGATETSINGTATLNHLNGPSSKLNFERFQNSVFSSKKLGGVRKVKNYIDNLKVTSIIEDPQNEDGLKVNEKVLEKYNPLITEEQLRIIEASIPKHTMQQLLGLNNKQFLVFKKTEQWIKKRKRQTNDFSQKEKHVEFAKELFKVWDDDNSGVLDLDEIAEPLVALGLSTDSQFVAKLIESLGQQTNKLKSGVNKQPIQNQESLRFTLKDFVKIFRADKVGEKISKIIKNTCIEKKYLQQQAIIQKAHQQALKEKLKNNQSPNKNGTQSFNVSPRYLGFSPDRKSYYNLDSENSPANGLFNSNEISRTSFETSQNFSNGLKTTKHQPLMLGKKSQFLQRQSTKRQSILILEKSNPSIAELMEIVVEWWKEIDTLQKLEQPIDRIAELLVKKGITTDVDSAKKVLLKYLDRDMKNNILTKDDFNQIFCRCIFKDSLIAMTEKICEMDTYIGDVPLTLKLGRYQRDLMMHGLSKSGEKQKIGLDIMNALFHLKSQKDVSFRSLRYAAFIADPLGEVAMQKELELLKEKKIDEYDKTIDLKDPDQLHKQLQKFDLDAEIENQLEEQDKILDKQKAAQKRNTQADFQIQPHISILEQNNFSSQILNRSKVAKPNLSMKRRQTIKLIGDISVSQSPKNQQDREISKFNTSQYSTKSKVKPNRRSSTLTKQQLEEIAQQKLRISDAKWKDDYLQYRSNIDKENNIINTTKNPAIVAMLSRVIEHNQANRVEAVKLPNIYKEKEYKERVEVKSELLEEFQKIMNQFNDFTKYD